jgi:hypothetical protein
MAPPVSAATRGPTLSITSRVPKGTTRGSTETVSRELGLPEAVTPLPVWQLTSKTPSSAPRALAVVVGARRKPAGLSLAARQEADARHCRPPGGLQ